eukprot:390459_1
MYFWNCEWWSDYSSESERLFIGGLGAFKCTTIRHIGQRKNFKNFIFPMTAFQAMIDGYHQVVKKATEQDVKYLKLMIEEETLCKLENSIESTVDQYILRLFHHFC